MYNNYNYYPQQAAQQSMNYARQTSIPMLLKGRPVSSLEEVRALSIDFDGSIFYFPDVANKCIYTKQVNLDGTATLNMYELKPIPNEISMSTTNNNYITREEFEQALIQLKQSLTPVQPITEPTPPRKEEVMSF